MTAVVGTASEQHGTTASTFTVPTGVTSGMVALFVMGSANSTNLGCTLSKAGVTFTVLDSGRTAGNMNVTVIKATGLVAGDTVTLAQTTAGTVWLTHHYQDVYDYTTPALSAAVRGSSITTCTTGSITPASGQLVAVVSLERTTATPTTVSSVVSSGGETVTQDTYAEDANTNTSVSGYLGHFTASAAAARTVTITYSGGSGNGYAALIGTSPIVIPNPGVAVKYTSATDTLSTGHLFYTSATDTWDPLESTCRHASLSIL